MSRRALEQFRIIGEAWARANLPAGAYNPTPPFFDDVAKSMYPKNLHRRQWARDNLEMFYNQEAEKIKTWEVLSNEKIETERHAALSRRMKKLLNITG